MHVFTLTDGVTDVALNDGSNVWTTGYSLDTPGGAATEATDRIELLFIAADNAPLMRQIEAMLDRATMRQKTRRGPRIFLTVELSDDDQEWRAEIFQGALVSEKVIDDTYKGKTRATLIVQRAPFWEGEEAELPLRNYDLMGVGDEPATGGVEVPNDPEVGCWVQIDEDTVTGALPAPIRLRLTNEAIATLNLRKLRIGVNSYTDIDIVPVIQAEDQILAKGADTAAATASDGNYWTSDSFTTAGVLGQWAMPTGLTETSGGRWWWLLARVLTSYTTTAPPAVWALIYDGSGVQALWTGEQVRPDTSVSTLELLDFGPVPIPPGAYDDDPAPVRLAVFGESASAETMAFDYFYLFPMDAFRRIEQPALGLATNDFVEIDEIERRYYLESATGRIQLQTVSGSPLVVAPEREQRIHLLYRTASAMAITDAVTVQVWYRPRRLTL